MTIEELELRIKELELENAILRKKLNPQVRAFSPETPLYHVYETDPNYFTISYSSELDPYHDHHYEAGR